MREEKESWKLLITVKHYPSKIAAGGGIRIPTGSHMALFLLVWTFLFVFCFGCG